MDRGEPKHHMVVLGRVVGDTTDVVVRVKAHTLRDALLAYEKKMRKSREADLWDIDDEDPILVTTVIDCGLTMPRVLLKT